MVRDGGTRSKHGGNEVGTAAQIYGLASPEPTAGSRDGPPPRGPRRPRHRIRRRRRRGGCPSTGLQAGGVAARRGREGWPREAEGSDAAAARERGSAPRAGPPHRRRFFRVAAVSVVRSSAAASGTGG
uniref:Uncharacterized protein n=1 Tax=Triticum urartu TaxID=4572 RepID=A0A8R7V9S1_TRIUA